MKAIFKPTAPHMYMIQLTGETIYAFRPSVATVNEQTQGLVVTGKVKAFETELPDTANDADFLKFLEQTKGDEELAIQSYIASLSLSAEEQEALAVQKEKDEAKAAKEAKIAAAAADKEAKALLEKEAADKALLEKEAADKALLEKEAADKAAAAADKASADKAKQ